MLRILLCLLVLSFASCDRAPKTPVVTTSNLHLEQTKDHIRILHADAPVLEYRITSGKSEGLPAHYERTGFLHPIYSPSGQVVTDDFPAGYAHQHGLFTAWTNTTFRDSFVDFWNTQKGLATVRHEEVLETMETDGFLGFKTKLTHFSLVHDSLPVLDERYTVRVHDRDDVFVWDFRSEQRNVTEDTLFLNKHLYGGLGIRGSKHWNAADSTHFLDSANFLTSEGLTRADANHSRPDWTAIYGELPGGTAGLVVIPHPDNFRAPQPVRVHPELPYCSVSPVVEEGFTLLPGELYVMRYRVVVFDGGMEELLPVINELTY
ncbi:MAG: PmoA family protein [Bacteroidota bacterium]